MRLLIVEDNAELSRLVAGGLSAAGYESDIVGSAAEAREAVSSVSYAAMILDLGLPDGDGLSVLRELRRQMEPLPVLVLTARGGLQDRVSGLRSGADDYLAKPVRDGGAGGATGGDPAPSGPVAWPLAAPRQPRL
ncbi:DNA-binding response OmpR family regulator [Bradyrhizobium sp. GM0.4]